MMGLHLAVIGLGQGCRRLRPSTLNTPPQRCARPYPHHEIPRHRDDRRHECADRDHTRQRDHRFGAEGDRQAGDGRQRVADQQLPIQAEEGARQAPGKQAWISQLSAKQPPPEHAAAVAVDLHEGDQLAALPDQGAQRARDRERAGDQDEQLQLGEARETLIHQRA